MKNVDITFQYLKKKFKKDLDTRKSVKYKRGNTDKAYSSALENDGTILIKDFFKKKELNKIKEKVNNAFYNSKIINPGRDLSGLTNDNIVEYFKNCKRINRELIEKGERSYSHITDNIQIINPFINIPELMKIAADKRILDIAYDYLGACPAIAYIKVVKNFANDIPKFDTQYFHIDKHAAKMFKVFIYLNNVQKGGGPHCFIKHSHKEVFKEKYWKRSTILRARVKDKDVVKMFGSDSYLKLYGKLGDIIIEDTTGWHKAEKPISDNRSVIIITYGIGKEYSYYNQNSFVKIKKEQYNNTDNKNILDFADITNE